MAKSEAYWTREREEIQRLIKTAALTVGQTWVSFTDDRLAGMYAREIAVRYEVPMQIIAHRDSHLYKVANESQPIPDDFYYLTSRLP